VNSEIANRLTSLRKQSRLSHKELAAKLGVTEKTVSDWEQGETSPDVDNLISLSELYDISFNALLETEKTKRVSLRYFPYGMIVTFIYLVLGLFFHMWGTAWVLFLTIPIYAGIGEYLHRHK